MKCPHCTIEIHEAWSEGLLNNGQFASNIGGVMWAAQHMTCPACKKALIRLRQGINGSNTMGPAFWVYPAGVSRPVPIEVPTHHAADFLEAVGVLSISPKASAALSRRCVQAVLRDQGFNQKDLAPAIQAALDSKAIPSSIADNLDAIRNIGNFAAHPMKDTNSGAIVDVEPHEAEWNLDVLEQLFDLYYVQPAKAKARRDALNAKLQAAGKPPMKN